MRKYTVAELRRMRLAIHRMEVRRFPTGPQLYIIIEDQLRTYISNETDPEELWAQMVEEDEKREKRRLKLEQANG